MDMSEPLLFNILAHRELIRTAISPDKNLYFKIQNRILNRLQNIVLRYAYQTASRIEFKNSSELLDACQLRLAPQIFPDYSYECVVA